MSENFDLSSQAGDDDAPDQGCNPIEHGAGLDDEGAPRGLRRDRLEVAQAGQSP